MPFSEMQIGGQPAPDQIEVCVFGPNYGECVVVHLGNRNWVVIDSCLHEGEPIAIAYLQALGLDPARSIRAVIATHWHDDHHKGLSQILANAPAAHVWISSVLTNQEFLRFAMRMNKNKTSVAGHKLDEFLKVIGDIRRRRSVGQLTFGYANARTAIFRLDGSVSGHGYPCEIMALSPSHGDVSEFLERIVANMPTARQTKRTVRNVSHGGTPVDLAWRRRKIKPLRLVVLLDASGSMNLYTAFFVRFLHGVVDAFREAEAFIFHTRLAHVSPSLRDRDVTRAVDKLSMMAQGIGGDGRSTRILNVRAQQNPERTNRN